MNTSETMGVGEKGALKFAAKLIEGGIPADKISIVMPPLEPGETKADIRSWIAARRKEGKSTAEIREEFFKCDE